MMRNALLLSVLVCAGAYAGTTTYTGFYTGKIMPTPQQVTYHAEAWEVPDLTIVVSPQASEAEKLAAEEIANRVWHLSGNEPPIRASETLPAGEFIALGVRSTTPFLRGVETPGKPEGYAIEPYEGRGLLLSGRDAAGAYFAAQTVVQLFEQRDGKLLLHPVTVQDWPVFPLRSFKTGGAYDPGGGGDEMRTFAPFAKYNCYNICYTSLGADKWVAPPDDYRQVVQDSARYMKARGLDCMPFVNPYYLWKEHIETSDEGDLAKLFAACRIAPDAGGTRVMLCLDDFASEPTFGGTSLYRVRSEKDRAKFGDDLAAVNIAMINDLSRRFKEALPRVKLYVVLPYYWNPGGPWKAAGEDNLRAIGKGLDPDVTIVWTGPSVRSAVIGKSDVDYYQGLLGGRKVMLWDNTIYMYHNPPYYLFDEFKVRFPDGFETMTTGEVHLNTGGGAIYRCGLLSAADKLWNPAAFEPEASLRNAIAALAGPEHVDDLLAFRDAFYTFYDRYAALFGKPAAFLAKVKTMTARPFDEGWVEEIGQVLEREKTLAEKMAATCPNKAIGEECLKHASDHDPCREALALLAKLPPLTTEDAANVAPNPDAEQVAAGKPVGWGRYAGAGTGTLAAAPGRKGGQSGKLTATTLYDWGDGRTSINVALMIGDCDGFEGSKAPEVLPLYGYYYSFWMKGSAPRVVAGFVGWDAKGTRESRSVLVLTPEGIAPKGEWTFYSGKFVSPFTAARGALKIGIDGFTDQGAGLGEVCVDDVYVGRSKAESLKGGQ